MKKFSWAEVFSSTVDLVNGRIKDATLDTPATFRPIAQTIVALEDELNELKARITKLEGGAA